MRAILVLILIAVPLACTKAPKFETKEWRGEGQPPLPASLNKDVESLKINSGKLEFKDQQVHGVSVKGAFAKVSTTWAKMRFVPESDLPSVDAVKTALQNHAETIKQAKIEGKDLPCQGDTAIEEARPAIQWVSDRWELTYVGNCEDRQGQSYEFSIKTSGEIFNLVTVGSQFIDVTATLYSKGPKLSDLKALKLSVADKPNYLFNSQINAVSDAGAKISELNIVENLKPGDIRFDLIQVYHYANQILAWAAQKFSFTPQALKIRTHVGFPDNTNASFYFNREVRLGAGDGKTFSQISLDPSIVDHEVMHSVVESFTHLPFQGQGGSLNEGLSDILTAIHLDSPRMGENAYLKNAYQRTLENESKYSQLSGALYGDSLIFSGLIWEIRKKTDDPTALSLIQYLLTYLSPVSDFKEAKALIAKWNQETELEQKENVASVLKNRGWL